ncbi:MAG: hypothetical protein HY698_07795 [Deltaproteobacteria bacterium]|nr:hypothetical protein [Deltaproteobacteria bacterium]
MRVPIAACVALVAVLLQRPDAHAIPRFAVREGLPCMACHVNPSGGGMRNRYGRYVFAPTELAAKISLAGKRPLEADIGDTLSFGADARTAYIEQRVPDKTDLGTIFQMQSDLYVAAHLFQGLTLYYDRGSYGSFEAISLYEFPLGTAGNSAYVKAGRFMPTYGLRLENHNLFVRQDIGFGPRDKDVGLEVGTYLGPFLLQASVLDGMSEDRRTDDNRDKAVLFRGEFLWRGSALRLMTGGSVFYNQTGALTKLATSEVDSRSRHLRFGAHLGIGLGRFAYLGEADVVKVDPFAGNKDGKEEFSFQSFQELDVLLFRGLDLNLTYEFREPDLDLKSGRLHRLGGGIELYPIPYAELKLLYRHSIGSGPSMEEQDGAKEFIAMAHLFY